MGKNKFWELVAHTTCRSYGSSLRSAVVCRCSAAVVLVCTNQQTLSMPPASRCNSKVKQIKKETYRGYILLSSIGCARCMCALYRIQQMIVVGWLLENGHSADDEWQQSNGCSSKYKMSAGQCVWLALLVSTHTTQWWSNRFCDKRHYNTRNEGHTLNDDDAMNCAFAIARPQRIFVF